MIIENATLARYLQKSRHDAITALESKSQGLDIDRISLFPGDSNFKKKTNKKNGQNQVTEVAKVAVSVSP